MSAPSSKGVSPLRILAVTGGLCLAGGMVGALIGLVLVGIYGLVADGPGGLPFIDGYGLAVILGALFGGILVPLSAWTVLRRVPFGRVFSVTAVGTALGCFAGLFASDLNPFVGFQVGVAGYLAAVVYLAARSRRERTASLRSVATDVLPDPDGVVVDEGRLRSPSSQ